MLSPAVTAAGPAQGLPSVTRGWSFAPDARAAAPPPPPAARGPGRLRQRLPCFLGSPGSRAAAGGRALEPEAAPARRAALWTGTPAVPEPLRPNPRAFWRAGDKSGARKWSLGSRGGERGEAQPRRGYLCHPALRSRRLLIEGLLDARPRAPHFTYSNSLESPDDPVGTEDAGGNWRLEGHRGLQP